MQSPAKIAIKLCATHPPTHPPPTNRLQKSIESRAAELLQNAGPGIARAVNSPDVDEHGCSTAADGVQYRVSLEKGWWC